MIGQGFVHNLTIIVRRHSFPATYRVGAGSARFSSSKQTDLTKVTHTGQVSTGDDCSSF